METLPAGSPPSREALKSVLSTIRRATIQESDGGVLHPILLKAIGSVISEWANAAVLQDIVACMVAYEKAKQLADMCAGDHASWVRVPGLNYLRPLGSLNSYCNDNLYIELCMDIVNEWGFAAWFTDEMGGWKSGEHKPPFDPFNVIEIRSEGRRFLTIRREHSRGRAKQTKVGTRVAFPLSSEELLRELMQRLHDSGYNEAALQLNELQAVGFDLGEARLRLSDGRLHLFIPGETPHLLLIDKSNPHGLKTAASLVAARYRQMVARQYTKAVLRAREELDRIMASSRQRNPWIRLTRPYQRLVRLIKHPVPDAELIDRVINMSSALSTLATKSNKQVADFILTTVGFSEDLLTRVARLQNVSLEDILLGLFDAWYGARLPSGNLRNPEVTKILVEAGILPKRSLDQNAGVLGQSIDPVVAEAWPVANVLRPGAVNELVERVMSDEILRAVVEPQRMIEDLRSLAREYPLLSALERALDQYLSSGSDSSRGFISPLGVRQQVAATRDTSFESELSAVMTHLAGWDPGVPDVLVRSFLRDLLQSAVKTKVYGLPEVEYWVRVPDEPLASRGIERMQLRLEDGRVVVYTAPVPLRFPLVDPPTQVAGGPLFALMMAGVIYHSLVTRKERFVQEGSGPQTVLRWSTPLEASERLSKRRVPRVRRIRVTPLRPRRGTSVRALRSARPTYVTPHLRLLAPGRQPSERALQEARRHGVNVPAGYTFVRAYVRGQGDLATPIEFAIADIVLATIARLRRSPS